MRPPFLDVASTTSITETVASGERGDDPSTTLSDAATAGQALNRIATNGFRRSGVSSTGRAGKSLRGEVGIGVVEGVEGAVARDRGRLLFLVRNVEDRDP
jgi:hypothetical protein